MPFQRSVSWNSTVNSWATSQTKGWRHKCWVGWKPSSFWLIRVCSLHPTTTSSLKKMFQFSIIQFITTVNSMDLYGEQDTECISPHYLKFRCTALSSVHLQATARLAPESIWRANSSAWSLGTDPDTPSTSPVPFWEANFGISWMTSKLCSYAWESSAWAVHWGPPRCHHLPAAPTHQRWECCRGSCWNWCCPPWVQWSKREH